MAQRCACQTTAHSLFRMNLRSSVISGVSLLWQAPWHTLRVRGKLRQLSSQQRRKKIKKSRKAKTDPYLALLEYRNTPSQGMDNSSVVQLMSRQTRTQVPTLPQLLRPVVDHNVHDKLLINKEHQASNYHKGAKDTEELKSGDTVHLIPPWSPSNEAVKVRVDKPVGTWSYEVIIEDSARYR